MQKRKLLKIELELVLPEDIETAHVMEQIQKFLLDEFDVIEQHFDDGDNSFEWMPFDCRAITMTLLEEHNSVGIEMDDEGGVGPPPLIRQLKKGSA